MNEDFWKRFQLIPGFDCIKMKREIQAKIHEETKGMSQEERIAYYRRAGARFRRRRQPAASAEAPLGIREEPASYGAKKPRRKG
jgi:hypothetical protein